MVVAPLLQHELPVDLPVAQTAREAQPTDQITLTIAADGGLTLADITVKREELGARLEQLLAGAGTRTIFLAAAAGLSYGTVVEVMDRCRAAGVTTIGVLTRASQQPVSPEPAQLP
jgi:biopolymer transport protein TolR